MSTEILADVPRKLIILFFLGPRSGSCFPDLASSIIPKRKENPHLGAPLYTPYCTCKRDKTNLDVKTTLHLQMPHPLRYNVLYWPHTALAGAGE